MTFGAALELVLSHEGGYSDHPADPGGRTLHGISERAHPDAWIGGPPSKDAAAAIYRREYWDRCGCDLLPPAVALIVFDAAVNQGAAWAVLALQRVLGVRQDGRVGPITAKAAAVNPAATVAAFAAARLQRYAQLRTFGTFGKGWCFRLAAVVEESLRRLA